jgi:hypothetical protein
VIHRGLNVRAEVHIITGFGIALLYIPPLAKRIAEQDADTTVCVGGRKSSQRCIIHANKYIDTISTTIAVRMVREVGSRLCPSHRMLASGTGDGLGPGRWLGLGPTGESEELQLNKLEVLPLN